MIQRVQSIIRTLVAYSSLLTFARVPTTADGVEKLASDILALFNNSPEMSLVVRRRISEALLHGANKSIFVLKLRYYMEIRSAMAAGAAFGVLQTVKEEEKARAEQAAKEANSQVVQEA